MVTGAIAVFAMVALRSRHSSSMAPLEARIVDGVAGLTMVVAIPGLPAGTVVRCENQSHPLGAQGQAEFSLTTLQDRVGVVDVPIEVDPPNGEPQHRSARVVLGYRVDPDLSGLATDPPELRLMFRVVPGSRLSIDGQPVATDASGAGVATMQNFAPLSLDGPDTHQQSLHVQVTTPDGVTTSRVYELRVPRTALSVDRPVASELTSADRLVVRGRAPGSRTVSVNHVALPVVANAFETIVPLASLGPHALDIEAFSPNGAPALRHLEIERVAATDRASATRFVSTAPATMVDLAAGPAAIGRHIRLQGRMLGVPRPYQQGQTFQLVVNDRACGTTPCLVWIDLEPGQSPNPSGSIEVIGTVSGRRASETAGGAHRSDPVIDAAFLF